MSSSLTPPSSDSSDGSIDFVCGRNGAAAGAAAPVIVQAGRASARGPGGVPRGAAAPCGGVAAPAGAGGTATAATECLLCCEPGAHPMPCCARPVCAPCVAKISGARIASRCPSCLSPLSEEVQGAAAAAAAVAKLQMLQGRVLVCAALNAAGAEGATLVS